MLHVIMKYKLINNITSSGRSPAGPGNFLLGLRGVDPGVALPLVPTGVVNLSLTEATARGVWFP